MRTLTRQLQNLPRAAFIGAALALAAAPVMAQNVALPPATITVTGEGSVSRAPDMATISIGVTSTADTAVAALAENSEAMRKVIERLKAAGIADQDLQTSGLSVNPNWSGYSSTSSEQRITGFTASNMLTVAVRELDALGGLLDAAMSDGANTLNGVSFALVDQRPALDEARVLAVADAKARAELLAGAAGLKLGTLVTITETGSFGGQQPMFRVQDSAGGVPIQRGEVGYQANVSVTWTLAD